MSGATPADQASTLTETEVPLNPLCFRVSDAPPSPSTPDTDQLRTSPATPTQRVIPSSAPRNA